MTTARELGLEAARAQLRYHGWKRDGSEWTAPEARDSYLYPDQEYGRIPDPAHGPTGSIDISAGYGVMVDVWGEWFEPWVERAEDTFRPWSTGKLPDPTYFAGLARTTFETAHTLSLTGEEVDEHRVPTNPELVVVGNTELALLGMSGETIRAFREQWVAGLKLVIPSLCGAAATICEVVTTEGVIFHEAQLAVTKIAEGALEAMREAGINQASVSVENVLTVLGAGAAVAGLIAAPGFGTVLGVLGGVNSLVETGKKLSFKGTTADEVLDDVDAGLEALSADIASEEEIAAAKVGTLHDDFTTYSSSYRLDEPRVLGDNTEAGYAGTGGEVLAIDGSRLIEIADHYLPVIGAQFQHAYDGVDDAYTGYTEWDRDHSIGRTPTGAKPEWNQATYELASILRSVPDTLDEVSHHLRLAAQFHGDNDAAVSQSMQEHTASL